VSERDAIVVGAGHNGLVAAILLAKAGWQVTVVERNAQAGGAIRTAEVTLPGFKHDLYATNLNLFLGSRFYAEHADELAAHGFGVAGAARPFGSVFPGGEFLGVSTDAEQTRAAIAARSAADAASWQRLAAWFDEIAPALGAVLSSPLPSAAAARALWRERGVVRAQRAELVRLALQSPRELVEESFGDPQVRALVASWGMHLDFPPDMSGGAVFGFLETFASARYGMALGAGGASTLVDALVAQLRSAGGELLTDSEVTRVVVQRGRAAGVELADGRRLDAAHAVIANLNPTLLFGRLVDDAALPDGFRRAVGRYRHAPGTLMVHLALDELPAWSAGEHVRKWCYVHLGPYLDDMSLAYARAMAGLLPERPTLVIGQPTAVDPSRAPEGKHVLWVQVRMVPAAIRGDAAGVITATDWETAKEHYADRVVDLIAEHAPGLRERVLARHVLSPADIERDNPNLVGGDQLGGSHHLAQSFLLRPFPGWSRYRTPVERLYMCGAGTWPGAGVGAASGYLLGKELANDGRLAGRGRGLARRGRALARRGVAAVR
jgi:phytoene dehydrogenase-like protein